MVALMAPGPAISGVASGKTEMSGRVRASSSSPRVVPCMPPEWRANTMSIRKSAAQQDAAGDPQRRQGDAEQAEQRLARRNGKEHRDASARSGRRGRRPGGRRSSARAALGQRRVDEDQLGRPEASQRRSESPRRKVSACMGRQWPSCGLKCECPASQMRRKSRWGSRAVSDALALAPDAAAALPRHGSAGLGAAAPGALATCVLAAGRSLRPLVVPPPAPVSVEIVTEQQYRAAQTPAPPQCSRRSRRHKANGAAGTGHGAWRARRVRPFRPQRPIAA